MKKKIIMLILLVSSYTCLSQVDSTYYYKSKEILDKYPKSRIKPEFLYKSALIVYKELGILVPYRFAIAQCILETSLGTSGVGRRKNNPYSINSRKGYKSYKNIEEGILDYYFYISKNYLKCKTVEQLFKNFTNCKGKRYATERGYEHRFKKEYSNLK